MMQTTIQQPTIPPLRANPLSWLRWWLTPRASERDDAFRERVMRYTILIVVAFMVTMIPLVLIGQELDTVPVSERLLTLGSGLVLFIGAGYVLQQGRRSVAAWLLLVPMMLVSLSTINDYNYWTALSAILIFVMIIYAQLVLSGRQLWFSRLIVMGLVILPIAIGTPTFQSLDEVLARFSPGFTIIPLSVAVLLAFVMLQALVSDYRRNLSELRDLAHTLEQRVDERTRELADAKQETEVALQRAIAADQMKSQFLASMSHELRTPLNSILTFTELMQIGTFGEVNDEQRDYLGKTLYSGKHLLALINDVLDITKIQSGMMKLFMEDGFDVSAEMHAIIASTEKQLGDKPVRVIVDVDADIPPLRCDKRRMRQVLLNLISNAVKFTEEGSITLSAKKQGDSVLFAVMDTGPGIAPDQHEVIFEPFIQTETGIQHAGGTGLGLPISRRLVEVHGGRMWLESALGAGASFFFAIPLRSTQPEQQPINDLQKVN